MPAYSDWLNAIPAAILLVDGDHILFANRSAAEWIGCPARELAGLPLDSVLDDDHLRERTGSTIPVTVTTNEVEHEGRIVRLITLEKRELYRSAIEGSIEAFALLLAQRSSEREIVDFLFVDINPQALDQMRKPRDQVVGRGICELMSIDRSAAMFLSCVNVVEQQKGVYQEFNVTQRAIRDGWYQIQLIPMGDYIAVFNRDITARKEAEEIVQKLAQEVEQQARMLDEILGATPDVFILLDRAGHYLFTNRTGLENSGLTAEQVTGKTWRELGFPEEVGLMFDKRLEQVFTTGESITYDERFPTVRGLRDWLTTLTPIHDQSGEVVLVLNTLHDITERKQAEIDQSKLAAELEQQARLFDEVLSTTPDTFLMFDRDSKFLYASPSALRNSDLKLAQVIGKTWQELGFPADNGEQADRLVKEVFATGETLVMEETFPTVLGLRNFESIFSPLHDKEGNVVSVVVTNRDITARKQAEEALRESQKLFTSIYETALVGIGVINAEGNYVQVNRRYCDIYGYTAAEMIGKHFTMVLPPELHQRGYKAHERFMMEDAAATPIGDWEVVRKDGQRREIVAYNNLLIREDGERSRVVVTIDVSEQNRAQRALKESEQRLTSILASMQDVVWSMTTTSHELLYVNPAIEVLTGYSPEEFHTEHGLLFHTIYPDDRAQFAAQLLTALDGTPIDTDYRITRRDGALRWVHNRFWLVRDAEGNPVRIDGIMSDSTDRRQAAEHEMQWAVERERVRILSEFVRDASHEFRTPLSVINTRLYLMEKVNDPLKQGEYIEGIKEQAERILKLVESLITMSRLDSISDSRFERLDMNRLLTVMNMSAEAEAWRKGIQFNVELPPDPLYLRGEMNDLVTAFNAVFDNAITYTPEGGLVSVRSYHLNEDELAVDVKDTGVGIDPTELPHIFERFYRADRSRSMRGFGLGLTIARKIVERHGGRIEVESEPQQGSVFRLVFPLDQRTLLKHETGD